VYASSLSGGRIAHSISCIFIPCYFSGLAISPCDEHLDRIGSSRHRIRRDCSRRGADPSRENTRHLSMLRIVTRKPGTNPKTAARILASVTAFRTRRCKPHRSRRPLLPSAKLRPREREATLTRLWIFPQQTLRVSRAHVTARNREMLNLNILISRYRPESFEARVIARARARAVLPPASTKSSFIGGRPVEANQVAFTLTRTCLCDAREWHEISRRMIIENAYTFLGASSRLPSRVSRQRIEARLDACFHELWELISLPVFRNWRRVTKA